MNPDSPYFKQIELVFRILQLLSKYPCFAIKGGAAINLFVRELPRLTPDQKEFLLSFNRGEPDRSLISYPEAENLPAIRWKLKNTREIEKNKHQAAIKKLDAIFKT